jgi:hypothetical protein
LDLREQFEQVDITFGGMEIDSKGGKETTGLHLWGGGSSIQD